MSLFVTNELSKTKKLTKLGDITKWASGGTSLPLVAETQTDLGFTDAVDAAVAAVAGINESTERNARVRAEAVYKLAFARDALYASAGRHMLFELSVHNAFRETYEGGKVAIDMA